MGMTSPLKKESGFHNFLSLVVDTVQQMRDGELRLVAGSLAYSTVLGLVPFMAVVAAIFQMIGGLDLLYPKMEYLLLQNMKEAAGGQTAHFIRQFLQNISAGKVGTTGAFFLLLTSLRLIHVMDLGIHRVWNQTDSRPFYKRVIYHWLLLLLIPMALATYVAFMSLEQFQLVQKFLPAFITNSLLLMACLFLIYKFVPDRNVATKNAAASSMLAAISLYCVHKGFALLAAKVFSYNKIYGSFAAVPLLLLWILSIWYVVLGGVALSASLEKRRGAE